MAENTCLLKGCDEPHLARGWCNRHYLRWKRYGHPLNGGPPQVPGTVEERFWKRVNKNGPIPNYAPHLGPCWVWLGNDVKGYGRLNVKKRAVYAHRWAWMALRGPIPEGLVLDHLCRVTNCVNPAHLEPVTQGENARRGMAGIARGAELRAKTHCLRGHPFNETNTYWPPKGGRICRQCQRERRRPKS